MPGEWVLDKIVWELISRFAQGMHNMQDRVKLFSTKCCHNGIMVICIMENLWLIKPMKAELVTTMDSLLLTD